MVKQLHDVGVELVKGVGAILTEFVLSLLLLGAGAVLVTGVYRLLIVHITPLGMLAGFVCLVPITYIFVRLTQGEIS